MNKSVHLSKGQFHKLVTESVKRVLREGCFCEGEDGCCGLCSDEDCECADAPNELAEAMCHKMYSQAAAILPRMSRREVADAMDYMEERAGYVECLESMLLCMCGN